MEEIKNETVAEEVNEAAEEKKINNDESDLTDNYTEYELSGLTDKQRRRKHIMEKVTTGLLILLMASPVAIILYIFLWFILR